jgi:hypothetical protein
MVTVAAQKELNNLKTTLELSANGVKNTEMAVKGFRYSLTSARDADGQFAKSDEYRQLEKHFSTFRLPKSSEMKSYTATAIALIDKAMAL